LRHVLITLVFQAPVLAAMASAVLLSGSLRSDDILAAQGGWPWQWFAFASPVALGIFVLHYPPLGDRPIPGAVRAAAHEDINFITLLVGASAAGLEVRSRKGEWVPCADKTCSERRHTHSGSIYCNTHRKDAAARLVAMQSGTYRTGE